MTRKKTSASIIELLLRAGADPQAAMSAMLMGREHDDQTVRLVQDAFQMMSYAGKRVQVRTMFSRPELVGARGRVLMSRSWQGIGRLAVLLEGESVPLSLRVSALHFGDEPLPCLEGPNNPERAEGALRTDDLGADTVDNEWGLLAQPEAAPPSSDSTPLEKLDLDEIMARSERDIDEITPLENLDLDEIIWLLGPQDQPIAYDSQDLHGLASSSNLGDVEDRMRRACRDGDIATMRALIQLAPSVVFESHERSLLGEAVCSSKNTVECIQLLLEAKASPRSSSTSSKEPSPVFYATMMGKLEVIELLLKAGASYDDPCQGQTNMSALVGLMGMMHASAGCRSEQMAAQLQCIEAVLLTAYAQPSREIVRACLFNIWCERGTTGLVRLMLGQKMDPNLDYQSAEPDAGARPLFPARGHIDWTPLMRACAGKHHGCVKMLLEAAANLTTACTTDAGPKTPMQMAQSQNDTDCIRLLISMLQRGQKLVGQTVQVVDDFKQALTGRLGEVIEFDPKEGMCRVSVVEEGSRRIYLIPPAKLQECTDESEADAHEPSSPQSHPSSPRQPDPSNNEDDRLALVPAVNRESLRLMEGVNAINLLWVLDALALGANVNEIWSLERGDVTPLRLASEAMDAPKQEDAPRQEESDALMLLFATLLAARADPQLTLVDGWSFIKWAQGDPKRREMLDQIYDAAGRALSAPLIAEGDELGLLETLRTMKQDKNVALLRALTQYAEDPEKNEGSCESDHYLSVCSLLISGANANAEVETREGCLTPLFIAFHCYNPKSAPSSQLFAVRLLLAVKADPFAHVTDRWVNGEPWTLELAANSSGWRNLAGLIEMLDLRELADADDWSEFDGCDITTWSDAAIWLLRKAEDPRNTDTTGKMSSMRRHIDELMAKMRIPKSYFAKVEALGSLVQALVDRIRHDLSAARRPSRENDSEVDVYQDAQEESGQSGYPEQDELRLQERHLRALGAILCHCAEADASSAVLQLLDHSGFANSYGFDLVLQTDDENTALWYAASNGNRAMTEKLIGHGAQVNFRKSSSRGFGQEQQHEGPSVLGIACQEGHRGCAELLLEALAHVDGGEWFPENQVWHTFVTPLMFACDSAHCLCVRLLLEHNASADLRLHGVEKGGPELAIEFAEAAEESSDSKLCIKMMQTHGAKEEMLQRQRKGQSSTSLLEEQLGGKAKRLVLKNQRAPKDPKLESELLHWAIRHGDLAFVSRWLRDGGRDRIDERCLDGYTPLEVASRQSLMEPFGDERCASHVLVSKLLKSKANPNTPDGPLGCFPLLLAATQGSPSSVDILLAAGADGTRKTRFDRCAAEHALAAGRSAIAQLIVNHAYHEQWYKRESKSRMLRAQRAAIEVVDGFIQTIVQAHMSQASADHASVDVVVRGLDTDDGLTLPQPEQLEQQHASAHHGAPSMLEQLEQLLDEHGDVLRGTDTLAQAIKVRDELRREQSQSSAEKAEQTLRAACQAATDAASGVPVKARYETLRQASAPDDH